MAINSTRELEGFLAELGLGTINEAEAFEKGSGPQMRTNGTETGTFAAIGQQLGRNIAPAVGGLVQAVKNSKGEGEFSFTQGVKDVRDQITARGAGLEGGKAELRSRKRIRQGIATANLGDTSTVEGRIKLAEFVAKQAQVDGNGATRAAAINKVAELRKEKVELDKLKSGADSAKAKAHEDNTPDVWLTGEANPRTAQRVEYMDEGIMRQGVEYYDPKTQTWTLARAGEYSETDPSEGKDNETLDQRLRRMIPKKEFALIKDLIVNNDAALRKYDRVLTTTTQLYNEGLAEAAIGPSGNVVSGLDNLVRNTRGVATAFFGPGAASDAEPRPSDDWQGKKAWMDKASDASDSIWEIIDLPQDMRTTSTAAQNHRANIMELAYMAARLAEPSNRGLSDNDIKNALVRIAGDTSNPQVMFRRFVEMIADGAHELDTRIKTYHGSLEGISNDQIDRALGGEALPLYRERLQGMYDKHGLSINRDGRAVFQSVIDDDFAPEVIVEDAEDALPTGDDLFDVFGPKEEEPKEED